MRQNKTARMLLGSLFVGLAMASAIARASGVLVGAKELDGPWRWSARAISVANRELRQGPTDMPKGSSVLAFRLKYKTQNLKGEPVIASGLVRVRSDFLGSPEPVEMISYQHSTRVLRSDSPSENVVDPEAMGGIMYFASRGYLWAMPDYLGLGSNKDPQSYLHAKGQARVCADFLLAVDEWAQSVGLKIRRELILMGYSQGGHSTLALQKYLESKDNHTGFGVRVSFPMAGPYSVAGVGLAQALQSRSSSQLLFVALALYGLSSDPTLNVQMSDIVNSKYASLLPKLLGGDLDFAKAADGLPKKAEQFFSDSFLVSVAAQDAEHPTLRALRAQDVVDFYARAPVYLVHSPDDEVSSYENSVLAEQHLKARGSQVELIKLQGGFGHVQAAIPSFAAAAQKLEQLNHQP